MSRTIPRPRDERLAELADYFDSFTLALPIESFELRESSGQSLSDERRLELLAAVRQGQVVELTMTARPFRQSQTARPLPKSKRGEANANFAAIPAAEMERFAASFTGRPFLRDHERNDLLARGGTVEASQLGQARGWHTIEQTIRLVKPWAVEAALDGTLETFSIGWDPGGRNWDERIQSIQCTACQASIFDCSHFPGDEAKVDGADGTYIVEAEFRGAIGAEVSAVTFPAVKGTGVDSIRTALSDARNLLPRKAQTMNPEILKRLGLAADATSEQIERALAAKLDDSGVDEIRAKLAATEEQLRGVKSQLETDREERKVESEKTAKVAIAALAKRAREGGLWAPGSAAETYFHKVAARDLAEAEEYVGSLSPVIPLRQPRQTPPASMTAPTVKFEQIAATLAQEYGASELQVGAAEVTFRKMRISPAMFEQHGPHVLRDSDDPWLDDGAGSLDYRKEMDR